MSFLKTLLVSLLLTAALLAGGLAYLNSRLSAGLADFLKTQVFTDPAGPRFEKAGVELWRGRAWLRGLRFNAPSGWKGSVAEIAFEAPARRLLVSKPVLELAPDSAQSSSAAAAGEPAFFSVFKKLPLQELAVQDGTVRLQSPSGGSPLAWEAVSARMRRGGPSEPVSLHADGKMSGQKSSFSLDARVQDLDSPCSAAEGQVRVNALPVPALAAYFPADPEMKFLDGQVSLNTQFTCRKDWLTASHLVEIKDFSVDVSEGKKKILGVSVKYLKDLFRIEQLSFVLPMNGAVADPRIGLGSSVSQILFKMLEGKFEDKDKAEALAKKGGDYFGKKLDASLKDWLRQKKR